MKKTIIMVAILFFLVYNPKVLVAEDVIPPAKWTLEDYINDIFGDKANVARAVIFHESNNKLDAIGYNCFYYRENGTRYSTSCKSQDIGKAWSVDCGIGQINTKGRICPAELLTLEGNMKAVEQKYKTQGLNAWVSYKTGRYLKYM